MKDWYGKSNKIYLKLTPSYIGFDQNGWRLPSGKFIPLNYSPIVNINGRACVVTTYDSGLMDGAGVGASGELSVPLLPAYPLHLMNG